MPWPQQDVINIRHERHHIRENADEAKEHQHKDKQAMRGARLDEREGFLHKREEDEHIERCDQAKHHIVHEPCLSEDVEGQDRIIPEWILSGHGIRLVDHKTEHQLEHCAGYHSCDEELDDGTKERLSLLHDIDLQGEERERDDSASNAIDPIRHP